ncbi:RING/U-box superfamily protein [Rhynchospora pubera]|uniref:RING/U-box superfamily protein n=1 Tax=Rhynchospora pubera TaxID=906938 RepID=A0AAV8CJ40_9POAL|nr:RING/U-box superfamily protein [Rhynchospora pubera]
MLRMFISQVEYCTTKGFGKRFCETSCSTLQVPLIFSEANISCVKNMIAPETICSERRVLFNPEKEEKAENSCGSQNPTTSNLISNFSWKRSSSLPAITMPVSDSKTLDIPTFQPQNSSVKVSRSISVPVRNIVIVRSMPVPCERHIHNDSVSLEVNQTDKEILEEEALCRICFVPLNEAGSWLRMQCSCKGDLRLVHNECAVKWFSLKGNTNCDVCGSPVANLPVTLIRVPIGGQGGISWPTAVQDFDTEDEMDRVSHDFILLSMISSLCYFFFILELLATRMKHHAVMIAAPFSLTLGILGSILSVSSAWREHSWAYSAFQFTFVAVYIHISLSVLQLHVALAILLAFFAGFGLTVGLNFLCLEIGEAIQARRFVNLA